MSDTIPIPVSNLLFDGENPRLAKPNVGQREALREIVEDQQTKVLRLAEHIVEHGMNPSELPIVMQAPNDGKRFVVLEGNRRLAALRGLENPDSLVGAAFPPVLNGFRKISQGYHAEPVENVACMVVRDREEARPWIELRHTGENEGAGLVRWDSSQAGRFRARTRIPELHLQVLDFLEKRGLLSLELRRKVPATSLKRLLGTPAVRAKVGIDMEDQQLKLVSSEGKAAKALMWVVNDLASGRSVKDIYHSDQRIDYANNVIPASVAVATSTQEQSSNPATPKKRATPTRSRARSKLIPRDCILSITDPRIRDIEIELRDKLILEDHPNAISVLLRVFIELSCDDYIVVKGLSTTLNDKLSKKIQDVVADLITRKKLTREQALPTRQFATKNSFLAPSIGEMNGYVHNQHIFPAAGDLRTYWNNMQPFMTAVWAR